VIVITDNAKYHHAKLHSAWRQKHQAHFRLDYLPPYSPDLNPIERVEPPRFARPLLRPN
jgi:transposase